MRLSLAALVAGIVLGGAMLTVPNEGLRSALARFPADAYWYAGIELVFSAACIYALLWGGGRWLKRPYLAGALALLGSSNLLYHFPPLMAVVGELAADSAWARDTHIGRSELLRLWRRPEILSLWAHFVLASFAIAPLAALCRLRMGMSRPPADANLKVQRQLAAFALAATALQIPVGLWLLLSSDAAGQASLLGGDLGAAVTFGIAICCAFWLLQTLLSVALGEEPSRVARSVYLVIFITFLMTSTLRTSRRAQFDGEAPQSASRHTVMLTRPHLATSGNGHDRL
jgi:hypothetical protein